MTEREKLIEILGGMSGIAWSPSVRGIIADYLLANGVTVQKWIPVTERLPERNGRYLCNIKSFSFPGKFYQKILMYDEYGFREGYAYTDDVTHWMPLPNPPKEVFP